MMLLKKMYIMLRAKILKIQCLMLQSLKTENFTARLAKANLVSINDIANFVKKTDFDNKLIILNKTVTSNKHELNEPSEKVKSISTKGLTKYLVFYLYLVFLM